MLQYSSRDATTVNHQMEPAYLLHQFTATAKFPNIFRPYSLSCTFSGIKTSFASLCDVLKSCGQLCFVFLRESHVFVSFEGYWRGIRFRIELDVQETSTAIPWWQLVLNWRHYELNLVKYLSQKTQTFLRIQFCLISNSFLRKKLNISVKIYWHFSIKFFQANDVNTSCNKWYLVKLRWQFYTKYFLFLMLHVPAYISPTWAELAGLYCRLTSEMYLQIGEGCPPGRRSTLTGKIMWRHNLSTADYFSSPYFTLRFKLTRGSISSCHFDNPPIKGHNKSCELKIQTKTQSSATKFYIFRPFYTASVPSKLFLSIIVHFYCFFC